MYVFFNPFTSHHFVLSSYTVRKNHSVDFITFSCHPSSIFFLIFIFCQIYSSYIIILLILLRILNIFILIFCLIFRINFVASFYPDFIHPDFYYFLTSIFVNCKKDLFKKKRICKKEELYEKRIN